MMRLAALIMALTVAVLPGSALAQNAQAILAEKPPKLLSEYGFFEGPGIASPVDGVVEYDLATPLFSDHALKFRHVHVPAGQQASWSEGEAFEFPVGSALVKTFAYPADFRAPDRDIRLIETRLLLRQADGWKAYAYVWNDAQTDAELKIAGKRLPVSFVDAQGTAAEFSYAVPNRNQCKGCHDVGGNVTPIGPKARNLNRVAPDGGGNQLAQWVERGMLASAPSPEHWPAGVDWRDEGSSVEARARAWLDVNCAHCHRRDGPASNSGLFLVALETDPVALGIGKRPVAAGRGAGDNEFDIVAGKPEESILLTRVESTEPGVMMPELGRNLEDQAAVELLRKWILTLR